MQCPRRGFPEGRGLRPGATPGSHVHQGAPGGPVRPSSRKGPRAGAPRAGLLALEQHFRAAPEPGAGVGGRLGWHPRDGRCLVFPGTRAAHGPGGPGKAPTSAEHEEPAGAAGARTDAGVSPGRQVCEPRGDQGSLPSSHTATSEVLLTDPLPACENEMSPDVTQHPPPVPKGPCQQRGRGTSHSAGFQETVKGNFRVQTLQRRAHTGHNRSQDRGRARGRAGCVALRRDAPSLDRGSSIPQ